MIIPNIWEKNIPKNVPNHQPDQLSFWSKSLKTTWQLTDKPALPTGPAAHSGRCPAPAIAIAPAAAVLHGLSGSNSQVT